MFAYAPTIRDNFEELAQGLSEQKTSILEDKILDFWRENEPKKVQDLLDMGMLKQAVTKKADALLDMKMALAQSDNLPLALAEHEAWSRLMRIEEDAAEEAAAWGMTLEEYLNRPFE